MVVCTRDRLQRSNFVLQVPLNPKQPRTEGNFLSGSVTPPPPPFGDVSHFLDASAGAIQFYSEGARNVNMTLMYELLGDKAKVRHVC